MSVGFGEAVRRVVSPAAMIAATTALVCGCAGQERVGAGTAGGGGSPGSCAWNAVATPNPRAGHESQLVAVAAPSTRSAWAVGNYFSGQEGGPHGPIVERWDGRGWSLIRAAVPAEAFLSDVSADSVNDVWRAGSRAYGNGVLIDHWTGEAWRPMHVRVAARYSHLLGIDALSPSDVWAVGGRSDGHTGETLTLHWDGVRWAVVPSPSPAPFPLTGHAYAELENVDFLSPDDGWAVGEETNVAPAGASSTLILHWDGRRWVRIPSPNVHHRAQGASGMLFSVDAATSTDVWAAGSWNDRGPGFGGGGDHSLVERWDGVRWRIVSTPTIPRRDILYAVLAESRRVWAVGDRAEPYHILIEQRRDGRFSVHPARRGSLGDLAGAPDGRLWAVGQVGDRTLALSCAGVNASSPTGD